MKWLQVLIHPRIAWMGFREGWDDLGLTFDDDPYSARSIAYDVGRNVRRLVR